MAVKTLVIPIPLGMVNAFALKGTQTVLVDTGFIGSEAKILRALQKNGIGPQDVSLILITHGHSDHFGNAASLKQKTAARVGIAAADAMPLRTGRDPYFYPISIKGRILQWLSGLIKQPALQGLEPDILINGEMDLADFGVEGRIILTPGHTDGSVSILLASGEMIVGDLIQGGWINHRSPSYPFLCQNKKQLAGSIQKVLDLKPAIIYAGHGGPFTLQSFRKAFK